MNVGSLHCLVVLCFRVVAFNLRDIALRARWAALFLVLYFGAAGDWRVTCSHLVVVLFMAFA